MDGVLVVDKPQGPTSHDVVAVARRALRERRIGHTGTLDPMATGVLPLVIGRATRLSTLLTSGTKEYEADVRLGSATPTYDAAERLAQRLPPPPAPSISPAEVERVLESFRGTFEQLPPPFSAKKIGGVAAYRLARQDQAPELTGVRVTVHALEVLGFGDGLLRLRVSTSPGFYVRSLAHDIGVWLGCGAHLEALRRTRSGGFGLERAVTLDVLTESASECLDRVVPLDALLPDLPAVTLTERGSRKAAHGNSLGPDDLAEMGPDPVHRVAAAQWGDAPVVRLFDGSGTLLGLARRADDGLLRPSIVLV